MADEKPRRKITFVEFCSKISVTLEAGQLVFCLIAFDGVQPRDLPDALKPACAQIFGDAIFDVEITPLLRRIISVVFGGRGGKTYLGALRGLHLAITVDLSKLAPGQRARVWFIAPDLELASEAMSYVAGVIESQPSLKKLVIASSTKRIVIRRNDGKLVAFETKAATRMGTGTRGRVIIFCMMDEAAFFLDGSYKVNDKQIFEAVSPRVMMGGQLLLPSTPWAEAGLLWDLHEANWNHPQKSLAAHAPTKAMRSDADILRQVDDAYDRDKDNAEREFGAKFLSAAIVSWFDPAHIQAAIKLGATLGLVPGEARLPQSGDFVSVAADLGMNKNSSAAAAAHRPCVVQASDPARRDSPGPLVLIADLLELRPTEDEPLRPTSVCASVVAVVSRHGASTAVADGHYKESLREALTDSGLDLRAAPTDTSEPWVTLRSLFRAGAIALPDDPLLAKQLKSVRWRALSGGRASIILPTEKDGRHCDLAEVVAKAANDVWEHPSDQVEAKAADRHTSAWEQAQEEQRLAGWAASRKAQLEEFGVGLALDDVA